MINSKYTGVKIEESVWARITRTFYDIFTENHISSRRLNYAGWHISSAWLRGIRITVLLQRGWASLVRVRNGAVLLIVVVLLIVLILMVVRILAIVVMILGLVIVVVLILALVSRLVALLIVRFTLVALIITFGFGILQVSKVRILSRLYIHHCRTDLVSRVSLFLIGFLVLLQRRFSGHFFFESDFLEFWSGIVVR